MKRVGLVCLAVLLGASVWIFAGPSIAWAGADPIVLGCPTSLYTPYGSETAKAAELAVEEINAAGGVKVGNVKRPFKMIVSDTRGGEPGTPVHDSLMAYEKLITENKPHAIVVGAFRSEVLIAAMDLVAKYKVPHLSCPAQTPMFQKKFSENPKKYKYLFRVGPDALISGTYINRALDTLKKKFGLDRVLFIYQDVLWTRAFSGIMRRNCKKNVWTEIGYDGYAGSANDFSPALTKAKDQNAQVIVMVWDAPLGSGIFCKQHKAMKVPAMVVGFVPTLASAYAVKTLGPVVEDSVTVEFPIGSSLPLKKVPKTVEFQKKLRKMLGGPPDAAAVISSGYDAVYILRDAIERANSLDPDKIVAALEKTDYQGVSGRLRFNKQHCAIFGYEDPTKTGLCTNFQWQKDSKGKLKRVPVYPPYVAEGKLQLPQNMKKK
ncbi:MAG: ABC transporter substrate-binding protein [Deltaproteobacteria bacterium]